MFHVLRRGEQLEELDRLRAPARDVVGELLQHGERPLAPPVADRVGDVRPLARRPGRDRVQAAYVEKVGDVRNDPRPARLDEQIVVEAFDVAVDDVGLRRKYRRERLERAPFLGVSDPVDRRQKVVQIGGRRHAWFTFTPSAALVRRGAAWATPPPIPARRGGRGAVTRGGSPGGGRGPGAPAAAPPPGG